MIKYPTASERDKHIADLEAAIERVRELHNEQLSRTLDVHGNPDTFCDACGTGYPCPTIEALDGTS